jgi:hypothetical protein
MAASRTAGGPYTGQGNFRATWYGAKILGEIDAAMQQAMDETAVEAKDDARSHAAVDTGEFRDSIDAVVTQTGAGRRKMVLSASARHSLYVILGTSRMPARDPIRPAMDRAIPKLRDRIRAALGRGR